ncbi:MAG: nitroreductase family protein [Spirochaetes bacterium]|nr:nitroreductase family protein [Spirochaetota bacterium]
MNKTITINQGTCKICNLCGEVCPNKIIKSGSTITYRDDRIDLCFKCGQCMAICPTESITIHGLSYEEDFFDLSDRKQYEDVFFDMIYTRRAVRNFQNKPVPKKILDKIINAISFAPPGFPPIKTQITVVSNPELIKKSLPYMIELYDSLVKIMKNPVIRYFIKNKVGKQKFKTMRNHLIPLLKTRLPELKNGVEDTLTRNAPAMILFHSDCNDEDITEDILIAATYGMLAAHSLGLGGSIMSIIPPAINKNKELRKMFNIPENNQVISSIIIGYPKYKYKRGIKRTLKDVKWL